jgi:hypothetical protein
MSAWLAIAGVIGITLGMFVLVVALGRRSQTARLRSMEGRLGAIRALALEEATLRAQALLSSEEFCETESATAAQAEYAPSLPGSAAKFFSAFRSVRIRVAAATITRPDTETPLREGKWPVGTVSPGTEVEASLLLDAAGRVHEAEGDGTVSCVHPSLFHLVLALDVRRERSST